MKQHDAQYVTVLLPSETVRRIETFATDEFSNRCVAIRLLLDRALAQTERSHAK